MGFNRCGIAQQLVRYRTDFDGWKIIERKRQNLAVRRKRNYVPIPRSRHICMSNGCFAKEKLQRPRKGTFQNLSKARARCSLIRLPVTDPLRAQQDGVIEIMIHGIAVTQCLPGMKDEWDLQSQLLLPLTEPQHVGEVIYQRRPRIFMSYQVEAFEFESMEFSHRLDERSRPEEIETDSSPQIISGKAIFNSKQSSIYSLKDPISLSTLLLLCPGDIVLLVL